MKNTVINRAKSIWSGVRNTWNALKKVQLPYFKAVGSFMSSKWNSIKKVLLIKRNPMVRRQRFAGSLKKVLITP